MHKEKTEMLCKVVHTKQIKELGSLKTLYPLQALLVFTIDKPTNCLDQGYSIMPGSHLQQNDITGSSHKWKKMRCVDVLGF